MAQSVYTFQGFSTKTNQFFPDRLYDIDLAKQDLLNEIYTRKGERVMEPQFGSIVNSRSEKSGHYFHNATALPKLVNKDLLSFFDLL